jgi:hypothetical protein
MLNIRKSFVPRFYSGHTASASTSISIAGSISDLTSTIVVAGSDHAAVPRPRFPRRAGKHAFELHRLLLSNKAHKNTRTLANASG